MHHDAEFGLADRQDALVLQPRQGAAEGHVGVQHGVAVRHQPVDRRVDAVGGTFDHALAGEQRAIVADFHEAARGHLGPVQAERDLVVAVVVARHARGEVVEDALVEAVHHGHAMRGRQIDARLPLRGHRTSWWFRSIPTALGISPGGVCRIAASCGPRSIRRVKPSSIHWPAALALPPNSAIPAARRKTLGECACRTADGQPALIEIDGLTKRFGSFTAVDNVSFTSPRRGAGLSRPERRRQVHHDAHAGGLHDADRRHRADLRPRRADRRRRRAPRARLPAGGRADLSRNDGRRLPALRAPGCAAIAGSELARPGRARDRR